MRNKAVLITGAGRGLGRALSLELARRGAAKLALVARNSEELEETVREARRLGADAHAIVADVGDPAEASRIAGQAAALIGPIGTLIQNASTLGPVPLELLADTSVADFARATAVNVIGPFALAKAVVGSMLLAGDGLVVHLSSDAAVEAYPRWGAYSAGKAALDHLTRIWAAELRGTGVRFLAFDPGEMRTRMHAEAVPDADPATLADPAEVARRLAAVIDAPEAFESGARITARELEAR